MNFYINLFNKLPIFDALRLGILTLVRRYVFKFGKIIYSQTGEDIIIGLLLKDIKNGFYLDVGCHHPYKISNTFQLYLKGWRGIVIDANENLIRKFQSKRKNDIAIVAAISDEEKIVSFYEFKESEVNTINEQMLEEWKTKFNYKSKKEIKTQTLTNILDNNLPKNQKIDLLTVDVEGQDFNVLKSLDFKKYRPKLIVIEIHHFDLTNISQNEIYNFLIENDYKLVSFATMNGYFIDSK